MFLYVKQFGLQAVLGVHGDFRALANNCALALPHAIHRLGAMVLCLIFFFLFRCQSPVLVTSVKDVE